MLENNAFDNLKLKMSLPRDEPEESRRCRLGLMSKFGLQESQIFCITNSPKGYGTEPSKDTIASPHRNVLLWAILSFLSLKEMEALDVWIEDTLREECSSSDNSEEEGEGLGLGMYSAGDLLDKDEIVEGVMIHQRKGYRVLLEACENFLASQPTTLEQDEEALALVTREKKEKDTEEREESKKKEEERKEEGTVPDEMMRWLILYRIERKRLCVRAITYLSARI